MNLDKNPEELVIIGNGFDLNLGFYTSYNHFIESAYFEHLCKSENFLFNYLKEQKHIQHWIDLENELSKYSLLLTNRNSNDPSKVVFHDEYNKLEKGLRHYLTSIEYFQYKVGPSLKLIENIIEKEFFIINFNYTGTVSMILKQKGLTDQQIKERMLNIHGSLSDDNIILGVADGANIDPTHIFLRKASKKNFSTENIETLFRKSKQIEIFGYSLGNSDHMYYIDYFSQLTNNNIPEDLNKITIYYYGDQGWDGINFQLDKLSGKNLSKLKSKIILSKSDTL